MKVATSRLGILFSPFAIGVYITAGLTWYSHLFFESRNKPAENLGPVESFLNLANQKSIDFRLKQRGERPGSQQVALLTIDEKAVASVGRWPWPRETLAKAVDKAVQLGANVIAFDMVFPEASAQPDSEAYQQVKQRISIPPSIQKLFSGAIEQRDSDSILAKMLAKNSAHVVQGAFGGQSADDSHTGQSEACFELLFSQSPESHYLEKKEKPLLVLEQRPSLPESLKAFYLNHLKQISEILSEGPQPKNSIENHDLKMKIRGAQNEFCNTWLDPKDDPTFQGLVENWTVVLETEGRDFKSQYPTFQSWVQKFKSASRPNQIPRITNWTLNLSKLTESGASFQTGFFNAHQDADGTIRRTDLVLRSGTSPSSYLPSLALKTFLAANQFNARLKIIDNKDSNRNELESLEIVNQNDEVQFTIPVDSSGRMLIDFAGRQKMFPHISMADLLTDSDELTYNIREFNEKTKSWVEKHETVKKSVFFKDKLFILGATAIGIYDLRVTPFEENYPGVEIHANILDNLIRHDFLKVHPKEDIYMLGILAGIGLLLSACLAYFGAIAGLSLALSMILCIALIDAFFLFGQGIVVAVILPLGLILILFLFLTSYKYFTEERGKKQLRNAFQKYVSPAIVAEILSDPAKIELGGRKATVTVFFSDIRGFTTISEKLDPRALSELLNRYLTPMTDLVFENRGTLDKYMGDAIMAFFGAPISDRKHAKHACRCALLSLEKLTQLKEEFKREGLPEIDIGIGLNTGEVSVGNMGSKTIQSYTVMGDSVNLASRLEGINKIYGTRIIISEFTYNQIKDDFVCREIDWVLVSGKAQPVKIFELIAEGNVDIKTQQMLKFFNLGYELYRLQNWSLAIDNFNQALELFPNDPVAHLYIERCNEFLIAPPDKNWEGVFTMKSK